MAMAVDSPVQRVLDRLPSAKRSGDGWIALCPAHDDHKRSLGVKEYPDGHVSLKCFAGCRKEDVLDALHLGKRDLSANRGRGVSSTSGKGRNRATAKLGHERGKNRETVAQGVASSATSATAEGLTLADLAEAKHLPPDFLRKLGLTDIWYANQRVVRIPYTSEAGEVVAVRFRLSLDSDQNFAWRSGDKVSLYGLERLSHVRDCGWVLIVEGESDCWTCWHHGLPALGVPGKSTWRRQWADYLKGLHVYVWCEPNAEDFALGVGQDLPQAHAISAPDGVKDLSEAHIQGMDVSTLVESLRREAEPLEELRARLTSADIAEVKARARTVLECEDPVTYVKSAIRTLGFGGDITPPTVTYLAATSRVLAIRPGAILVHLLLTGQSSAGKSFILGIVKRLLPPEGYHEIDAGSPRVLIYDESELKHRVLIFGEADSLPAGEDNPAASAIRNLLQDHYLHYQVTVKSKETGDYSVRSVEKDGPTVLITTSTRPLGSQLSTRLFTLEVTDSHEQIRAALETQASLEGKAEGLPDDALLAYQAYLQAKAPWHVTVPFAPALAATLVNRDTGPRLLRDFQRVLSLIKAVAVLRHTKRHSDEEGRLIARLEDYQTVRDLIGEMYSETTGGVTGEIREVVEAVATLDTGDGSRVTATSIATHLRIHKSTATRRCAKAARFGWLINRETRRGRPADYTLGDPLPEPCPLPTVEDIEDGCSGCSIVHPSMQPDSEAKTATGCTVAAPTDGRGGPLPLLVEGEQQWEEL